MIDEVMRVFVCLGTTKHKKRLEERMASPVKGLTAVIDAELRALESSKRARIVASPLQLQRSSSYQNESSSSFMQPYTSSQHASTPQRSASRDRNNPPMPYATSPRMDTTLRTSLMLQLDAKTQRQRVETLLGNLSNRKAATSVAPRSSSTDTAAAVIRSSNSLHLTNASSTKLPTANAIDDAALQPTQSVSVNRRAPRGTIPQVLLSDAHDEVVELRQALLRSTDALAKAQAELLSERTHRIQAQDDAARHRREVDSVRAELADAEAKLLWEQSAAKRREESNQASSAHHDRVADQLRSQLRDIQRLSDEWKSKAKEKDADTEHALEALRVVCEERDDLRSSLKRLHDDYHALLSFVEGPLSAFARDASKLKQQWTSLEVDVTGQRVALSHRRPKTVEEHQRQKTKAKKGHHHVNPSVPVEASGRNYLEKLNTDRDIQKRVNELLGRSLPDNRAEVPVVVRLQAKAKSSSSEEESSVSASSSSSQSSTDSDAARNTNSSVLSSPFDQAQARHQRGAYASRGEHAATTVSRRARLTAVSEFDGDDSDL